MMQFNKEKHQYVVDGIEMTSVSRALEEMGLTKPVPRTPYIQECADKGTIIHEIAELACKGLLDESSIDDRLIPYYRQIQAFLQEYEPKFLAVESPLYAINWRIAGRPDFIAEIPKEKIVIVGDWKSGTTGNMWAMRVYSLLCDFEPDEIWRIHIGETPYKLVKEKLDINVLDMLREKLTERVKNETV